MTLLRCVICAVLATPVPSALAQDAIEAKIDDARRMRISGRTQESVLQLQTIVADVPNHFRARYNLGLALALDGRDEEALNALKEAARLRELHDDPDATIYNSYGWQLLRTGQVADAIVQFEKGLQFEARLSAQSKSRLLANYGLALMQLDRYDDARPVLTRAAKEFDNPLAARNLDLIDAITGDGTRWTVVFGGSKAIADAEATVARANAAGIAATDVVLRRNTYRSIAEFTEREKAESALATAQTIEPTAYLVRMETWCPSLVVSDAGKECRTVE